MGHSLLDILKDDVLLNDSIPVQLPNLQIASKLYEDRLALDKEKSFDLDTIINQTQRDQEVFSGLGHMLLNNLLKDHTQNREFDILNVYDWLLIVASFVAGIALILAIFLHFKLRALMIFIAGLKAARANKLIPTLI